ncbi:tetratricopeptide repeat protein [Roseibacillus persicicus]|uniref:Tetratricopeptide repeat protein n=2 Tax=Roseibacillus persicicus TaxID=454148 RepID=A0A918TIZ4_9BACT|nr:hypothetical protein GCM10007100_11060 [Roseibacillus persicicus]
MTTRSLIVPTVAAIAVWALNQASAQPQQSLSARDLIRQGDALMQEARNTLSHDFDAAEEAYRRALAIDEKNPEALVGMAWVSNSNHDFPAGKVWAQKALAEDPRALEAYALMGDGAVELGDYEEAFDHFQAALDIRGDLSTYSRAAHLLWLNGDDDQAHTLMRQAIKSGGPHLENVAWCRAELAMMLLKVNDLPHARREAEAAVKLAPQNPRALIARGRVYQADEKYEKAIESFQQSAAITPTHDALAPLAELFLQTGETEKAKAQIEGVVKFHLPGAHHHGHEGGHHHHHHDHGHHHEASSQLALFLADHQQSLNLATEQGEAAYKAFPNLHAADSLAWCYFQQGKLSEAQRYSQLALRLGTSEPLFHFHAGMIEKGLGNEAAARKHLSHALTLSPSFHPRHAPAARVILSKMASKS